MLLAHQIKASENLAAICKSKGCAYLFGPPRVGKTLTALNAAKIFKETTKYADASIIVFTKKNAINGWLKYSNLYDFKIYNYEKIFKLDKVKQAIIIIDEAHNFSSFPKPSKRIKAFKDFCKSLPIFFISGTPFIEGYLRAYSQFSLSSYSPFLSYKNSYEFFRVFGISRKQYLAGRVIETYSLCRDNEIEKVISPYIVKITYDDAGFNYNNQDELIIIKSNIDKLNKNIRNTQMLNNVPLETASAVNQCLHQLCGGWYKGNLYNDAKLEWLKEYVKKSYGKVAIMAYFIEEQHKLQTIFKKITVLSSTKYCEGVDLSHYDTFILYSFGYSGSKFVQLRDRIVNLNKTEGTKVIIPLLDNGIDSEIYKVVSKKRNFNLKNFKDRA